MFLPWKSLLKAPTELSESNPFNALFVQALHSSLCTPSVKLQKELNRVLQSTYGETWLWFLLPYFFTYSLTYILVYLCKHAAKSISTRSLSLIVYLLNHLSIFFVTCLLISFCTCSLTHTHVYLPAYLLTSLCM